MGNGASFGLLLAGGIITLLVGIFVAIIGGAVASVPNPIAGGLGVGIGAVGALHIIFAIIMIWAGVRLNKGKPDARTWSIVALIVSIIGLVTGAGLFLGAILGLVGAALGLGASKK